MGEVIAFPSDRPIHRERSTTRRTSSDRSGFFRHRVGAHSEVYECSERDSLVRVRFIAAAAK